MATVVHVGLSLDKGGLETTTVTLSERLAARGHRSVIVALDHGGATFDLALSKGIECHALGGRAFFSPRFHRRLAALFTSLRPAVVHTHHFGALVHALPAAQWSGVPRIVHTEHSAQAMAGPGRRWTLMRMASHRVRTLVLVADSMLPLYRDRIGIAAEKLRVIPNGIDTAKYAPATDPAALRRELGFPADAFVAGSTGRLVDVKNYPLLLEAAARLKASGMALHVAIVGEGPERPALEALVARLGIGEMVHLLGWRDDTSRIVPAFDVFVLPSDSEAMPLALLEAMSAEVPPVATSVGDVPALIQDGETGLLIQPRDLDALCNRLTRLAQDPPLRRQMGAAARRAVVARYDLGVMANAYFDAYGLPS